MVYGPAPTWRIVCRSPQSKGAGNHRALFEISQSRLRVAGLISPCDFGDIGLAFLRFEQARLKKTSGATLPEVGKALQRLLMAPLGSRPQGGEYSRPVPQPGAFIEFASQRDCRMTIALSSDFLLAFPNVQKGHQKQVREFIERFREHPDAPGITTNSFRVPRARTVFRAHQPGVSRCRLSPFQLVCLCSDLGRSLQRSLPMGRAKAVHGASLDRSLAGCKRRHQKSWSSPR